MTSARLCVTVTGTDVEALRRARDAVRTADLIELRLDGLARPDVAGALADRRTPVIVTCRPRWEGGRFDGSEEERRRLLEDALRLGADYVDIEARAGFDALVERNRGRGIILSMHEFRTPRPDLADRVRALCATQAEVVKVAVHAERLVDTLPLLALGRAFGRRRQMVVVAMGAAGLSTRVLASRFGSCWTYAGSETGVGQTDPDRLLDELRFREVTETSDVYGVVGRPVAHSLSPAMHNAGLRALGLDAVYLPLSAADAGDFITFAETIDLKGASVTAPFKGDLLARLDDADPVCRAVNAVNTIRMDGRRWIGRNTDVAGFMAPLLARMAVAGVRAAVIGAGAAARSVAYALSTAGAVVTLYARHSARAGEVARTLGMKSAPLPPPAGSWDLLVNATPAGMVPDVEEDPTDGQPLDGRFVYDLVYDPPRTRLLARAESAGCHTLNGLPMLVEQAQRQFAWWTGQEPPPGLFGRAADAGRRFAGPDGRMEAV